MRAANVLQPITGFRTSMMGDRRCRHGVPIGPSATVSAAASSITTCCSALAPICGWGRPLSSIARDGTGWILNDSIKADMLVGAGGHWCPVARWLNPTVDVPSPLVVAQETEFPDGTRRRGVAGGARSAGALLLPRLEWLRLVLPKGTAHQHRLRAGSTSIRSARTSPHS